MREVCYPCYVFVTLHQIYLNSLDILLEHQRPDRRTCNRFIQYFKGSGRTQFCIYLCGDQRWYLGVSRVLFFGVPPHSRFYVQLYGYIVYQNRISMIRRRDPGHFGTRFAILFWGRSHPGEDQIVGPVIISAFLFFAVLANFIIRGGRLCLFIFWNF